MSGLYFPRHTLLPDSKVASAACDGGDHVEQPKDREACGLQASLTWVAFCWRCKTLSYFLLLHISARERARGPMGHFKTTLKCICTYHLPFTSPSRCAEVVLDAIVANSEPIPGDLGDLGEAEKPSLTDHDRS